MNYDRKYKYQQQRVQDLVRQVDDLEGENKMLKKEIEKLYQINDIINQELADTREACDVAKEQFAKSAAELKSLQENYKTMLKLMTQTKQHYEKAMEGLLKKIKADI